MKPPIKAGSPFDFQTPPRALDPLFPFLPKDWTIWECACGAGNLSKAFSKKGYSVIATDILTGHDFLMYEPEEKYHAIITNPPYDIKENFLERAYMLNKPFAFLLPFSTFETTRRQEMFKKHGVEVIIFDKRLNFELPADKFDVAKESKSWFSTAWFTYGLNIGKQLTFVKYAKK